MTLPTKMQIFDLEYKITYFDKVKDVDINKKKRYYGQCVYADRELRIYNGGGRPFQEVLSTILHEALHAITEEYHLRALDIDDPDQGEINHEELDVYSRAMSIALIGSGLIKLVDTEGGSDTIEEVEPSLQPKTGRNK
jgi:hypothetical protein